MSFSVTVVSLESATYQWYFGATAIPGATDSTYTISKVTTKNAGGYSVICANGVGPTASGVATLTVVDTPPVAHNDSYSVVENTLRTVSASAGVLANDTDANNDTLTAVLATNVTHGTLNLGSNGGFTYLPATNYFGTDIFYYRANDGASNSSVASVTLTILAPPSITNQPQSQVVVKNGQAVFSVGVTGTSPLHYQWYFQSNLLSGSTNSTWTDTQVHNGDAGSYFVVVTNIAGIVTSSVATLTIGTAPNVSTLGASDLTTNSALLNASVNPQGFTAGCAFLYGVTTNYGFVTTTNSLPATNANLSAAIPVAGLNPGTTYHFCAVATNVGGVTLGSDMVLTTPYLPPTATTSAASDVTAGSATFKGTINPQGTTASYYFKYGATTNYGSFTATNVLPASAGDAAVSMPVTGLNAGTVYHYKVVAINSGGTTIATKATFSTLSIPPIQFTGTTVTQGGQQYMQLSLTSASGASFTVIGSTNLLLPPANWTVLGSMMETAPGQYQFTDPQPATNSILFYRIQSQ